MHRRIAVTFCVVKLAAIIGKRVKWDEDNGMPVRKTKDEEIAEDLLYGDDGVPIVNQVAEELTDDVSYPEFEKRYEATLQAFFQTIARRLPCPPYGGLFRDRDAA